MLKFVPRNAINTELWNQCIQKSGNGLIYGLAEYLDVVAPKWGAIVFDNYKAVWPLAIKSKFGISIVYHPFFAQQLGVFSTTNLLPPEKEWIKAIPLKFIRIDISNQANSAVKFKNGTQRPNYLLNISDEYEQIKKRYNTNTKRILKKQCLYTNITGDISPEEMYELKIQNLSANMDLPGRQRLHSLITMLIRENHGFIKGIRNTQGEVIAATLFVVFKNRIIYLFSASSTEGKNDGSMHRIVDSVIKEYSGKSLTLDFEGSTIPGVARFFQGFGAEAEWYHHHRIYRLLY